MNYERLRGRAYAQKLPPKVRDELVLSIRNGRLPDGHFEKRPSGSFIVGMSEAAPDWLAIVGMVALLFMTTYSWVWLMVRDSPRYPQVHQEHLWVE